MADRERDPGPLGGVHDLARLLGGGREWLLHEERDPGLDHVEGDLRVMLGRDTDANRIQFFLEEIRRAREIGHVEAVRDDATGLHVRVGDHDDLGDFGVYPHVVLPHRANPTDRDPGVPAKLANDSAGGIRDARIAGLAVARTDPRNAIPPRRTRRSHGITNAAWPSKNRRNRSYDRAIPRATPIVMPVRAMNESSNRKDRNTIDLRNPRARRAPVS